jgi:hypothetical protein
MSNKQKIRRIREWGQVPQQVIFGVLQNAGRTEARPYWK